MKKISQFKLFPSSTQLLQNIYNTIQCRMEPLL